ncbi:MAG TPA: HRDC domain-containing protein [Gaiellales bacterium]|jgi:ribonuclease D|nr:HRDC domain-containing protein [Gaiellales bacterium]
MRIEQITTAAELRPLLDSAAAEERCALDTEFVWERTYAPALCLVQIATTDRLGVIDPLAGAPLEPVAELLADAGVEKVMHAPSGDLAAFVLAHDVRPANVYDTQVAAGFAGYGGSLSLERLLDNAIRTRLRHDEGFTDWQRRPLSPIQVEYAADDVRHLLPAADALRRRLAGQGREAWVAEEMAARYGPDATLVQNPDTAWRRVAGRGKLRGEGLAALRAAAAWREREARRRDLPAAWLIKDATLVELARRRPRTPAEAERVRGLQIKRGRQLEELLQAIASPGPPPEAEAELPADVRRRVRVVLPLASAVLQARCAAAGVASELVATRADLEGLIANQALESDRAHPLLHGWRRELAGESLLRLLRGEISLRVLPGPPHVIES